jgi:ribosomal protein S18 acetylase RimI-like enzyme
MNSDPPLRTTIELCQPLEDREVLALAAQAWPECERAGHWRAIRSALEAGSPLRVVLLAARQDGALLAAVLGQILPGRTAAVWPPQFAPGSSARPEVAAALLDQLAVELATSGAALAQAIVGPHDVSGELLRWGGFQHAGDLLYLFAPAEAFPKQPPELPFRMQNFRSEDDDRLQRLIERTYIGTLDCPQLDGLRQTADIVAGYRAVGEFRPDLWQFAVADKQDVGCLIVNLHPEVAHAEIVYLGIVPEARGRGWGRHLARQALWLAGKWGCERAVLAVDAGNDPAISAYAATGFAECDRRALWVCSLPDA